MINKDNEPNELRIKTLEIGFVKRTLLEILKQIMKITLLNL